jgi:hypothetical protein
MPFTTTSTGGDGSGAPGPQGPAGQAGSNGADALWNYTGEYNGGASYAVGDLATYDGQLWYRANANGGNVGDTPSPGLWNLLAAKGTDGTNGSSGLVYLGNYISGNGYVTDLAVVRGSDNNLYIAKANGGLADPVGNSAEWDIFSTNTGGGTANIGDITFDGVKIIGAGTASGDGSNRGTIDLVPDADLLTNQYHEDQYLIIDPTAPNHIHIRGGGTQDESTADLFVGGERNHVRVSDGGRSVSISSKPATVINTYTNDNPISNTYFITSNSANVYVGDTLFYPGGDIVTIDSITQDSPSAGLITITANLNGAPASFVAGQAHIFSHEESWNNYWQFGADGVLSGPAMGGLRVHGIEGYSESGNPLWVYSSDSVVINGGLDGEFLNDPAVPANQIATLGDLPTGATGTFETPDSKLVTVTNGIITSINPLT